MEKDLKGDSEIGQSEKEETQEGKESEVEPKEPVEEPEETEDVETLPDWAKARLKKAESDKENYKKGMLKYKKFSLTPEKKEKKEEEIVLDDDSAKFQRQTVALAEKKAEEKLEKANEKTAVSQFLSEHPEAKNDWDEIVANYSPKNGKESPVDILKDLQRAYVFVQYDKGTLDKKDTKKDAAKVADLSSVSKTSSKGVHEGKTLSESAVKMAERMKVDPKKLAKEDDSPYAEIKF